jgi:predicted transcriptional regulator
MTTDICTAEIIRNAIEKKLDDSGEIYESILYGIPEKQRGLLKALACEGKAERIQSGAFIKKYNLSSASSVQSAAKRLLDSDLITTENNNFYSISDRFLAMWLKRKLCLNWI